MRSQQRKSAEGETGLSGRSGGRVFARPVEQVVEALEEGYEQALLCRPTQGVLADGSSDEQDPGKVSLHDDASIGSLIHQAVPMGLSM